MVASLAVAMATTASSRPRRTPRPPRRHARRKTAGAPPRPEAASASPAAARVRLKAESAAPSKVFFYGKNHATYHYTISGDRPRNMKIQLVNRKNWRVVEGVAKGRPRAREPQGDVVRQQPPRQGREEGHIPLPRPHEAGADVDRSRTKGDDRSVEVLSGQVPAARQAHLRRRLRSAPRSAMCTRARTSSPSAASGSSRRAVAASSTAATRRGGAGLLPRGRRQVDRP